MYLLYFRSTQNFLTEKDYWMSFTHCNNGMYIPRYISFSEMTSTPQSRTTWSAINVLNILSLDLNLFHYSNHLFISCFFNKEPDNLSFGTNWVLEVSKFSPEYKLCKQTKITPNKLRIIC